MSGVDLYTVSKLLGHQSLAMTQRYAHLAPDYLKSAVLLWKIGVEVTPELTPIKKLIEKVSLNN